MPKKRQRAAPTDPEFYTSNEVCERLRISRDTLTKYLKTGALTGHKLPGGQWRIHRSAVLALLMPKPPKR